MPQMAPYNWLMLFLLFNMIMIMIISYNHFHLMNFNKSKINLIKNKKMYNWMW